MTIKDIICPFFDKERGDDSWIIDCETSEGCPVYHELEKAGVIDAHIIPGTKVLVTEKGFENAVEAAWTQYVLEVHLGDIDVACWNRLNAFSKGVWRKAVRGAFKAAEITIVEGKWSCEGC